MVLQISKHQTRVFSDSLRVILLAFFTLTFSSISIANIGVDWLASQTSTEGGYANALDLATPFQSTAETIETLQALKAITPTNLQTAVAYLNTDSGNNTETLARKILSNSLAGTQTTSLVISLKGHSNTDGGFGEFHLYDSIVLDTAFALLALEANGPHSELVSAAIDFIQSQQHMDGGFSLGHSNKSSIYIAALTSIALQKHQFSYNVSAQIDSATRYLQAGQRSPEGWSTDWETAIALMAIMPVTSDSTQYADALSALETAQLSNGSWGDNVYATALALRALALASNIQFPLDPTTGHFSGKVVDDTTGQPLADVRVIATGSASLSTLTDAAGRFLINNVEPGSYAFIYATDGYHSTTTNPTVAAGQQIDLGTIRMIQLADTGILRGSVTDVATGQPINGALIETTGAVTISISTGVDGSFRLVSQPGQIIVTASANGYETADGSGSIIAGGTVTFTPALYVSGTAPITASVKIIGTVVDDSTDQAISATINVIDTTHSTTTNATGTFNLTGVEAGDLLIEIMAPGYFSANAKVLAGEGSTIDLGRVRLTRQALSQLSQVSGQVTDASTGNPVAGANIFIAGDTVGAVSGQEGRYRIENVTTLNFSLSASAVGYLGTTDTVQLTEHGLATVNIELMAAQANNISIINAYTEHNSYPAYGEAEIHVIFDNADASDRLIIPYVKVVDSSGAIVEQFPGVKSGVNTLVAGNISLPASSEYEAEFEWYTQGTPPDNYQLIVQAFDASTNQLLAERGVNVEIESTQAITGHIAFDPPIVQLAANKPVNIEAKLVSKANIDISATTVTATVSLTNEGYQQRKTGVEIQTLVQGNELKGPGASDIDSAGNIYVVNRKARTVVKITPTGEISKIVTESTYPVDVEISPQGEFYILDKLHFFIRVDINGEQHRIQTGLYAAQAIEVMADGRVFIAEGNSLYEIASDGTPTQIIGGGLATPEGMVMDSRGTLFVASRGDNSISRYINGEVTTFVTGISQPYGMDIDEQDNIYVASFGSGSLLKVTPSGEVITIATGLKGPRDVKIAPSGDFVVTHYSSHEIVSITPAGEVSIMVPATIYRPVAAQYDSAGNLYVANQSFRNITRFTSDGDVDVVTNAISGEGLVINADNSLAIVEFSGIQELSSNGILTKLTNGLVGGNSILPAPDGDGYLVSESNRHRITRVDSSGQLSNYIEALSDSATITFKEDAAGNKFILNYANNGYLTRISTNGEVSRFASGLNYARGMSFSPDGGIYITEYISRRILYIDASGNTSVYAELDFRPAAISVTADGVVLVAEYVGGTLYQVDTTGVTEYMTLDYTIYDILTDTEGNLWASHKSYKNVTKINSQGLKEVYRIGHYATALESDEAGGVFIAGSNRISYIDSTGDISEFVTGGYLSGQTLNGIIRDTDEHLWVTNTNGLLLDIDAQGELVKRYSTIKSPRSMAYGDNGELIVVNANNTVVQINDPVKLPEVLMEGSYKYIRYASPQIMVISTNTTVYRLDLSTKEMTMIASGFKNISAIAVSNQGILAVTDYTQNQLSYFSISDGTEIERFTGLVSPKGLLFDGQGQLLVSNTYPDTISKVSTDGTRVEPFSSVSRIAYLHLEADGSLLGSRNGQLAHISETGTIIDYFSSFGSTGLLRDSDNKLLVSSASQNAILEYSADNTYQIVATGLSRPVDIEADSTGTLYIANKHPGVVNRLSENNGVTLVENGLPNVARITHDADNKLFIAYGGDKIRSLDGAGYRTEFPVSALLNPYITGLVVEADGSIVGSVDNDNLIFRLLLNDQTTDVVAGDVVHSVTLAIDDMAPGYESVELDFGRFMPEHSGDYTVQLTVNDGQTAGILSNNLHVGPNAQGSIALAQSTVFPGDRLVSGGVHIFGADSTSITKIEPDGTTLAAASYTNGRGIAADSRGNIYASDINRLVKITPAGEVSDFVTDISLGNGLAVDNHDNIYAGRGRTILKINQQAEVQTFATLPSSVTAVAVNNNGELYAIESGNSLSRIHEDGSVELITSVGLANPKALTIDVNGYFYVLNQKLVNNLDGTSGHLITRISPDGKSVSEYYTGANFEFEGVNLTADCSNNLLFSPFNSFGVSEETKIFQHVGDTGEVREVLYGPSIDPAMADMDVLFYDRLGNRLLIWTDLGNGKIFSFPASCGGIDTEVHLITRSDVDLMSTDPAPTSSIELPDGHKEYIWLLSEVDNRGENILLNFLFTNLVNGETRPALLDAYLQFNNSFVEGKDIRVPLEIPQVLASSQMTLNAALDRSIYGANDTAQITASVGNESDSVFDGLLTLMIQDKNGVVVSTLPDITINQLAGLQINPYLSEWQTTTTYTGDYQLVIQLYNSIDEPLAEKIVPFIVQADLLGEPTITTKVTTDKLVYAAWDQVLINARLQNMTANALLPSHLVEISVSDPDSLLIYTHSVSSQTLFPGNFSDLPFILNLVDTLEGDYLISIRVLAADLETLVAHTTTTFKVERSADQGVTGQVSVAQTQLIAGESNLCTTQLTNLASTDLSDIALYQRIYSLETSALISESSQLIQLNGHETITQSTDIDTTDYLSGEYACVLQIEKTGTWHDIAAAGFQVTVLQDPELEIDISTSITAGDRGRVLVLLDQDSTTEGMSCLGLSRLELSTAFDTSVSTDTEISAELSDTLGAIDNEMALFNTYTDPVNANSSLGNADLVISNYSAASLSLTIQAVDQVLGNSYQLSAILSDNTTEKTLQSGAVTTACHTALSVGDDYGDFTISELTLVPAANDPYGPANAPSPSEQTAYLKSLLAANDWSYTLVNHAEDFERELHTGGYSVYMLLSEQVKLSEQVQKELREAIYRGEGLLEAGSHDQRNGRLDMALGIKFIGKHASTQGISLTSSAVYSGGVADFRLGADKALRVAIESAESLGYFTNAEGHITEDVATTVNTYGEGHALYAGFDLLAEATANHSADNQYADFLLSALAYIHPQTLAPQAGTVYPVILSLTNLGAATPGRLITTLPLGTRAVDPGQASIEADNTLHWLFELPLDTSISNTVWLKLPAEPGMMTLENLVQSGSEPDYTDFASSSDSLEITAMPNLNAAVELFNDIGSHKTYKQAKNAIKKAQNKVNQGDYRLALKFLTQAADALIGIETADADKLRQAIAWAIRDVSGAL